MLLHDDAADWVETCPDPVRLLGESNPTRQTVTQFTSLFCQRFSLFFNGPYGYFNTEQPPELPQQPVLPEQPSQQSVKQPRIPEQALQSVLQLPDQPLQLPKQLMPVQSQLLEQPAILQQSLVPQINLNQGPCPVISQQIFRPLAQTLHYWTRIATGVGWARSSRQAERSACVYVCYVVAGQSLL